MAAHFLRNEHSGESIESAELVHEVYLKLVDIHRVNWQDRTHFLAIAARLMRRILVDRARRRRAGKRGRALKVSLDESLTIGSERASELVALDAALETLASVDARKAQVVELRFFGGLSIDEIAFVVQVSSDTVKRDWKTARAWLLSTLSNRAYQEHSLAVVARNLPKYVRAIRALASRARQQAIWRYAGGLLKPST